MPAPNAAVQKIIDESTKFTDLATGTNLYVHVKSGTVKGFAGSEEDMVYRRAAKEVVFDTREAVYIAEIPQDLIGSASAAIGQELPEHGMIIVGTDTSIAENSVGAGVEKALDIMEKIGCQVSRESVRTHVFSALGLNPTPT
ncbi:MAG: hypothetical protein SFW62_09905 [Alphaproteobacteria bacterium]|nr:hypothetical protein [Alphaproteobacteria bacterium]